MAPRRGRRNGLKLDGILLVDKPQDWTSHDVVNFVRGRYRLAKVGHGGTLDPMATGLLVLLLGKGTKYSDLVMQGKKIYEGTYTLGTTTNSQDADGAIEETKPVPEWLTRERLEALVSEFTGDILQIPPMVSAIKKDGVPLYKMARKGETIVREPRPVSIFSYEITDIRLPEIDVRVCCSKGTYIRTLAHDFGQLLGCGAHLSALRRITSGNYQVKNAVKVEALREMDLEEFQKTIAPLPEKNPLPVLPVYKKFNELPHQPVVLAIGAFDGLHRGHAKVIQQARELAAVKKAKMGLMRFSPHPSRILYPEKAPPLLCTETKILDVLPKLKVDFQVRLSFTPELSKLEPDAFMENLGSGIPDLKGIVVGPNWRFGYKGHGDVDDLKNWASTRGIEIVIAEDTVWEGLLISSTRIREAVRAGNLKAAAEMLGRPYHLEGIVGDGKKYGRELGFPTANFIPGKEVLLPPEGVYAMKVTHAGKTFIGAGYITHHPRLVEVHLLDFSGDLYQQPLEVDCIRFLRAATPISDKETLRERIQQDVENIREFFAS